MPSDSLGKRLRLKFPRVADACSNLKTNLFDRSRWKGMTLEQRFSEIYERNRWGSAESISGEGSTEEHTAAIRTELPPALKKLGVTSMLDIPCGDYNWMRKLNLGLASYIGADIVPALVERNRERYQSAGVTFQHLDVTADDLPKVDLVFCRDCLMHLTNAQVWAAVDNIVRSGASWAALTSFHESGANRDTVAGGFRVLKLNQAPFNFPPPAVSIDEKWPPATRKFLDFWKIDDLRAASAKRQA